MVITAEWNGQSREGFRQRQNLSDAGKGFGKCKLGQVVEQEIDDPTASWYGSK